MVEIRVETVTKNYGKVEVLHNISFTIADGHFAVLLGPSGCGKTTLLRCVSGLEKVDRGSVYLGDQLANDLSPSERDLAMVFQSISLFPLMTVRENIAFPLKVRNATQQAKDEKVREVAKILGIEDVLDKMPRELSGGEQQRVAIGRAIAREPKAFLMDEPLSSLDAPLRAQLRSELKRIQRELKVTTLYVTHDQAEALALADKIGVISKGSLLQYEPPQNIFESPSSAFVARFVGDPQSNILDVAVTEAATGGYFIEGDGFRYPVPEAKARTVLERSRPTESQSGQSARVQVSIRPEDVELSGNTGQNAAIGGSVVLDEPLTLYRVVSVALGPVKDNPSPTLVKVLVPKDARIDVGNEVSLRPNMGKAHFFERETGNLLA